MENPQHTYYYQEVESAFHKLKEVVQTMLSSYGDLNIPSFDSLKGIANIVEQFKWTNFNSEASLNLTEEELTDEQKETIALKNKDALDEIINAFGEIISGWEAMVKRQSETNEALLALSKLSNEFIIALINYNYDELADSSCDTKPIRLTSEELFCALSFLTNEQIRLVLSEQTPSNFNKLFTAYNKSKEEFIKIAEEIIIVPMYGLRWMLKAAFESRSSYVDYLNGRLSKDILMWSLFTEDMVGDDNSLLVSISESLAMGEDIDGKFYEYSDLLAAYDQNVYDFFTGLYHIEDMPKIFKKKVAKIYDEWRRGNPTLPDLESDKASVSFLQRWRDISISILDKWILSVIHEQMDKHKSSSIEIEADVIQPKRENKRLEFPTRISMNKPMDIDVKYKILCGLFNAYGNKLENEDGSPISREEFIYLFNGPGQRPVSYGTPYYWNDDYKIFAGLLRLLYFGQCAGVDSIIISRQKSKGKKKDISWSSKKQGLGKRTLLPIETTIQCIVKDAGLDPLKEVSLERPVFQKKSQKENDQKILSEKNSPDAFLEANQ